MTISVILTISSTLMIAIERYQVITNPFGHGYLIKKSKEISLFLMLITIFISFILFLIDLVYHFYEVYYYQL